MPKATVDIITAWESNSGTYWDSGQGNQEKTLDASYEADVAPQRMVLFIWSGEYTDYDLTSVKLGSTNFTKLRTDSVTSASYYAKNSVWYMLEDDIPSGAQALKATSDTEHVYGWGRIVTLSGVNQADPFGDEDLDTETSSATLTIPSALTVSGGGMVVAVTSCGQDTTYGSWTSGFTERFDENGVSTGATSALADKAITSDGTQAVSTTAGAYNRHVLTAISINPAAEIEQDEDTTAPTPDPLTWSSVPAAVDHQSITMTATTATDADSPPVQYYFECTTDGTKSSSWQSSATYAPSGLDINTSYSFRVKARDSAGTPNETGYSSTESATTNEVEYIRLIDSDWVLTDGAVDPANYSPQTGNSDRAVILIASYEHITWTSGDIISSVTFGGTSMTKACSVYIANGYSVGGSIWYMLEDDLPVGSSDFVITWGGDGAPTAADTIFYVGTLGNVDQDSPQVAFNTDSNNSSPFSLTVSLNTLDDGYLVTNVVTNLSSSNCTPTGSTEEDEQNQTSSTHAFGTHACVSDESPRTVSWSFGSPPNRAASCSASFRYGVAAAGGYSNDVFGVSAANISKVFGVETANISKVFGA